jgi:hypothetical protein
VQGSEILGQRNITFDVERPLNWLQKARDILGQFQEQFGIAEYRRFGRV